MTVQPKPHRQPPSFSLIYTPFSYIDKGQRANQIQSRQTFQAFSSVHSPVVGIFPREGQTLPVEAQAHYVNISGRLPKRIRRVIGPGLEYFFLGAMFAWRAYLQHIRFTSFPRIVYCREFQVAFVFNVLKKLGLIDKVIFEIHDVPDLMPEYYKNGYEKAVIVAVTRSALARSDVLLPPNSATRDLIQAGYRHSAPLYIVPNGHHFVVNADNRKGPEPPSPFRVGYAGLTFDQHGMETLLDGIEYLDQDIQVLLTGGQRQEIARIEQNYAHHLKSGRLKLLSRLSHEAVAGFYAQLHVGLLLLENNLDSRIFRCPLKMFEYMAMGLPIVAADLPSVRDVLNASNAVFFQVDDPASLANAVNQLYRDPHLRQSIAEQALSDSKNYAYARRAEKLLDIINQVVLPPTLYPVTPDGQDHPGLQER